MITNKKTRREKQYWKYMMIQKNNNVEKGMYYWQTDKPLVYLRLLTYV